jgi:serine/threonine protein kinase
MNIGDHVGDWVIVDRIADGGMGTVYTVSHARIGKRAALKLLRPEVVSTTAVERFLLEARVVNEIEHRNIVDIFDFGVLDDRRPYLVMEHLAGETLSALLEHARPPLRDALPLLAQMCEGLAAAHARGVVHRDLKPANIMVIDEGRHGTVVKILDWGIAKVLQDLPLHKTITSVGAVIGTAAYMAPEQARSQPLDGRADVYALGVIAYELLLGMQPFDRDSVADTLVAQIVEPPPPPRSVWPDIPPVLEQLLLAMLAKTPAGRPTARTVATALGHISIAVDPYLRTPPRTPPASARPHRQRERLDLRELLSAPTVELQHRRK